MEALGLAAGMSYARNWVGKVDWYIDNTGVINSFRRMHRWVANDWTKAGDRDVNPFASLSAIWRLRAPERSVEVLWVKYSTPFNSETRFGIPSTSPID
jgi:ribonuclease HI